MSVEVFQQAIPTQDNIFVFLKIEIVVQDGAIEALVEEKLRGRYLFVSANIVNHPLLSYVHAQLGALLPYHQPPKGLSPLDAYKPFELVDSADVLDDSPARTST